MENNVTYTYGQTGSEKSRLVMVSDGTGERIFEHDALGNVIREQRTIAVPGCSGVYTFQTYYTYDSWGRILDMTYPDGEVVTYDYTYGGDLVSMYGDKGLEHHDYVTDITYNDYGQRSRIDYDNGAYATYTYDALHRLSALTSVSASGTMQQIQYTMDGVGNINSVSNSATMIGTLGGRYTVEYSYDAMNRLTSAGTRTSATNDAGTFSTGMTYSSSGRLAYKALDVASSLITNSTTRYFAYCDSDKPHAPRRIYEETALSLTDLVWDAAGNLGQVNTAKNTVCDGSRFLFWTEDNRLHTVVDQYWHSYYAYDYAGERSLKLTGKNSMLDVNAEKMITSVSLEKLTLYPSPYIVLSEKGYTKHYYIGADRLCASIGGGGLLPASQDLGLTSKANALFASCVTRINARELPPNDLTCVLGLASNEHLQKNITGIPQKLLSTTGIDMTDFVSKMEDLANYTDPEDDVYFYHADHLGSASWITDASGIPVQHLQYLPFGESFVDQHTSGYEERYTFTGKEKDSETGYYAFGARYYDCDLSGIFLSVDPMSDKYPSISPYAYCAWNPVKLVDPDGREIEYASFKDIVIVFTERCVNKGFRLRFNDLKKSKETYVFKHNNIGDNKLSTDGTLIYINYSESQNLDNRDGSTCFSVLRHETEHAVQFEYGEVGFKKNDKGDWVSVNFDVNDEIMARDFESSNRIGLNSNALHNLWGGVIDTYEKKIVALKEICKQNGQPMYNMKEQHNGADEVHDDNTFMHPYTERSYK